MVHPASPAQTYTSDGATQSSDRRLPLGPGSPRSTFQRHGRSLRRRARNLPHTAREAGAYRPVLLAVLANGPAAWQALAFLKFLLGRRSGAGVSPFAGHPRPQKMNSLPAPRGDVLPGASAVQWAMRASRRSGAACALPPASVDAHRAQSNRRALIESQVTSPPDAVAPAAGCQRLPQVGDAQPL